MHFSEMSSAEFFGLGKIDEIWVSPHRRTLDTAAPAAKATGLAPRVYTDIFEAGGISTPTTRTTPSSQRAA